MGEEDVSETPETASIDERFGANLRRYREARGLSQSDVARRMTESGFNYHQQTVAKIEKNQRPVRLAEAMSLASIVHTDIASLTLPGVAANAAMRLRTQRQKVSWAHERAIMSMVDLWKERLELEFRMDDFSSPMLDDLEPDTDEREFLAREIELTVRLLVRTAADQALQEAAGRFYEEVKRPRGAVVVKREVSDLMMRPLHMAEKFAEFSVRGRRSDSEEPTVLFIDLWRVTKLESLPWPDAHKLVNYMAECQDGQNHEAEIYPLTEVNIDELCSIYEITRQELIHRLVGWGVIYYQAPVEGG